MTPSMQRAVALVAVLAVVALPIAIAQNVSQQRNQPALGQALEVRAANRLVVAPGRIEGQLLRPDGSPAGTHQVVVNNSHGVMVTEQMADQNGRFKLELAAGRYQVTCTRTSQIAKGVLDLEVAPGSESAKIVMFVQDGSDDNTTMIVGGIAVVAAVAGITLGTLAIIDNNSEDTDIFGQNNRDGSSSSSRRSSSSSASPVALSPS